MQKFTVLTLPNLLRVLKWLGYLAAGLCGLGAVFLLLLLLINLPVFDEDLHPDLAALPAQEAVPALANNAYAGLMGFRAAPGTDFVATGQALIQRYLDNRAAGNEVLTNEDYQELLGANALTTGLLPDENCRPQAPVCTLEQVSAAMREGNYDRPRMELVLQRYDALLALTALQPMGTATFMTPAPAYGAPIDAQKYALAERYNSGSSTIFLNQVAADLKFWKLVVRDGPWLLDKMIAIAALWTDMQMLSEYMTAHELSAEDRALIASFLVPLSAEELDISDAFMAEAQLLRNSLEYMHAHPQDRRAIIHSRLQLQLTLTNATTNQNYTNMLQPLVAMSRLSALEYASAVKAPEFQATLEQQRKPGLSPHNLYNLGGTMLLGAGGPNWRGAHTYIGRMHDINTMLLATRLQFELKGMARAQLPEAIRSISTTPPYSGVQFNYDAEAGWLAFDCYDPPSKSSLRCRVQL